MGYTSTSLAAGFAMTASPGPGGPSRQAARPVIPLTARPDNGGAGQVQRHRQVPSRRAAAPARPRSADTADRGDPAWGEGRAPAGRDLLPGKRRTCRVCYTPPASAVMARGDVAAGRRGRIADMTTHAAGLAAVSSLPLAGQRAAPACRLCVAGRWRVRRSRAARNSRFWCQSFAGLLLPRSHRLRCSGRLADSCPRQEETLSLAVSCSWRPSQRGGSRAPVSEPARPGEPGPAVAGLSGSRTARTVPARAARQASPLGWWGRSWFRPVATVASSCHSRPRA
jgi:hypothetical protein